MVWIVQTAAVLVVKLLQWAKAFEDFVKVEVMPKLPGWLMGIAQALLKWADEAKTTVYNKVTEIGAQIVAGIKKGVQDVWDGFMDWVG